MQVIRRNPIPAAVIGSVAVLIVLVLAGVIGGGSDDGAPAQLDTTTTETGTPGAPSPSAQQLTRPNVRTLHCDTLLPSDTIRDALGGPEAWNQTAQTENCFIQTDESDATIQIAPGSPADFDPAARIFDVAGVPVDGVGDLARWFGGPQANGDGGVGAIVVAANSEIGTLIFRIAVGRPDLDGDAQLQIARTLALAALPRFPGVTPTEAAPAPTRTPTPEPVVVVVDPEPADLANLSYVDNLLAREAAGEWTRAEGLIATLRLRAGELDESEVLRDTPLVDTFSSGLVQLAREYLADTPDPEESAEIERLLTIVAPEPAEGRPPLAAAPAQRQLAITNAQQPAGCVVGFPDFDDTCFVTSTVADGYFVIRPAIGPGDTWAGWTGGGASIEAGVAAIAPILNSLPGGMPEVEVWLSPGTETAHTLSAGLCRVLLGSALEELRIPGALYLQQAVAAEVARCYVGSATATSSSGRWWSDPLALYLSDLALPRASLETDIYNIPRTLAGHELRTGFANRSWTNLPYFQSTAGSNPRIAVEAATTMALSGLAAVPGIEDQLLQLGTELSDGIFFDADPANPHRYDPPAASETIEPGLVLRVLHRSFSTARLETTVPAGQYACMSYEGFDQAGVRAAWRSGPAGPAGATTSWSADLPETLEGTATFVLYSSTSLQLELIADRFSEDGDCDDADEVGSAGGGDNGDAAGGGPGGLVDEEDSNIPIPEPPCGGCPRTSFYSDWHIPEGA